MTQTRTLNDWHQDNSLIHLNHAAVGPWPKRTSLAITEFAEENARQGSLNYLKWIKIENNLRLQLQTLINAKKSSEIALLKNTSEALSVIAYGLDWKSGDNIVISNQEFPSNYIVWESLKNQGVEIRYVDLSGNDPEDNLTTACDAKTRLLSISSVQYSTGLKLNLNKIGSHCRQNNILFCVDAIQSIGVDAFDVQACNADFVVADGHKWMLGPEGVALFYCREEIRNRLQLKQYGWHMVEDYLNFDNKNWQIADSSRRFECGSPNMMGIHGLHASLSLVLEETIESIQSLVSQKIAYLYDELNAIKGVSIMTSAETNRRAGILTFKSDHIETINLFESLNKQHVFCAMRAGGVRLSPNYYTADGKLRQTVELIKQITNK